MKKLHLSALCALCVLLAFPAAARRSPAENPIVLGNTRITLITPTLFRIEYAREGRFVDEQTLFAFDRSHLLRDFTFRQVSHLRYEIETEAYRLEVDNDGFPAAGRYNMGLYLKKDGNEVEIKGRANSGKNLGGPISTLDMVRSEVKTQDGLLSRDGWYVIDDTGKDLIVDGCLQLRDPSHVSDRYYFVYGDDYKAAFASLGAISGPAPMTRKTMHGIWYCRWWDYTADEFLQIIDGYDRNDFPLDNIVFDMGWHTQKEATVGTGASISRGWTGYTWNPAYIPDPEGLIREIHDRGITVSLNDHPHDGFRPHEAGYADFLRDIRREKPSLICNDSIVLFDLGDEVYMRNFFKYAHRPSERIGVDFWWLDWQQSYLYPRVPGTTTSSLAWINKLYFENSEREGRRGASYSRWAGWGDHRYPIQFSGDAFANWDVLKFEVGLTATSSNAGCFYWAHDIGGFYGGRDPELYVRWTQFGALSAALKIHCTRDPKLDRRPWLHGDTATLALRDAYHLRARLMPYVYTTVRKTHETMVPMIRQMYVDFPKADSAYANPQQYLFGDLLLVAPITRPGEGPERVSSQKVWFPEGEVWYDWFNGSCHEGGQTLDIPKKITEFPLFVRGGWLLPMQPYTPRPATEPVTTLVLRCYPGKDGAVNTFSLYEDDGISEDYKSGGFAKTPLTCERRGDTIVVRIGAARGSYAGQPKQRAYRIELGGVESVGKVRMGRRTLQAIPSKSVKGYVIEVPSQSVGQEVVLTIGKVEFSQPVKTPTR